MRLEGTSCGREAKIRESTIWSNGRNCWVSKKGGGLNIRELKTQKKRLWKFVSPEVSLWKEVRIEKYGNEDKWMT